MKTILNTPPDVNGVATAWKVDLAPVRAANLGKKDGTVSMWIVNAPWSHPIWPNVLIFGVHLRNEAGLSKPVLHLEDATHEIMVLALDPDWVPEIAPQELASRVLPLTNFVGQFKAASDEDAAAIIEEVVTKICNGELNPDSDGQAGWVELFGNHCVKQPWRGAEVVTGSYNEGKA